MNKFTNVTHYKSLLNKKKMDNFPRSILTFSSHLWIGPLKDLLPLCLYVKFMKALLSFPILATSLVHLNLRNLITLFTLRKICFVSHFIYLWIEFWFVNGGPKYFNDFLQWNDFSPWRPMKLCFYVYGFPRFTAKTKT